MAYQIRPYTHESLASYISEFTETPYSYICRKRQFNYLNGYIRHFADKKSKCLSMIIEEEYIDFSFTEDFSAYYVKCFQHHKRNCSRIHFFLTDVSNLECLIKPDSLQNLESITNETIEFYLGFVVIRPLHYHFFGKTCLKKYEELKQVISIPCNASLLGVDFSVDSLPFQEQDKVLSVCATSSLWTFFYAHNVFNKSFKKSPYQITRIATKDKQLYETSQLTGLTIEMICDCIKKENLDSIRLEISDAKTYMRILHTYLGSKIPVIVIMNVYSGMPTEYGSKFLGYHAVTAIGDKPKIINDETDDISFMGDYVDEFYVHDDRVGPFARLERATEKYWKMSIDTNISGKAQEAEYYEPTDIIVGLYNKIRLPYEEVRDFAFHFHNHLINAVNMTNAVEKDSVVDFLKNFIIDIKLETTNSLKKKWRSENLEDKEMFLEKSLPRYCWIIDYYTEDSQKILEFVLDSTENKYGDYIVCIVPYGSNNFAKILLDLLNSYLTVLIDNSLEAGNQFDELIDQNLIAFYNFYHKSITTEEMLSSLYGELHIPGEIKEKEIKGDAIVYQYPKKLKYKTDLSDFKLERKQDYYIWVIDKEGCLLIGKENKNDNSEYKGHPTLLCGKRGRIGGELRFNQNNNTWEINNSSGRYTRGIYTKPQTELYLENVKTNFYELFFPTEEFTFIVNEEYCKK